MLPNMNSHEATADERVRNKWKERVRTWGWNLVPCTPETMMVQIRNGGRQAVEYAHTCGIWRQLPTRRTS